MRRFVAVGLICALAFTFVGSPTSRAATIASAWPVGSQPFGLAVDDSTGKVYVANSGATDLGGPSVSVIDPTRPFPGPRLRTTLTPNIVLVDSTGRRLYSSNGSINTGSRSLDIFDLDSGTRLASVTAGGLGMALDRATGRLYVCESGSLKVIDTTTFAVVASTTAPASAGWFSVAADPARHHLYVTNINEASPSLFVLDDRDLTTAVTIPLATATRFAIAVDPATGFVYVAGGQWNGQVLASAFSVIDPDTLAVAHQISLPGFALGMALAPSRHRIYVSDNEGWRIYGIDDRTFEVAETISEDRFIPGMVAIHSDGRLYVGDYDSRSNLGSSLLAVDLNNHAPVFQGLTLTPSLPFTNDTLHADALASDPDLTRGGSAPVSYTYQWGRNHSVIAGANSSTLDLALPGNGDQGDYITVTVTASDGQLTSTATAAVVVGDSPGTVFVEFSNPAPRTDENLAATVRLVDLDNESYHCTQAYYVNGVLLFEVQGCFYTYHLIVHDEGDRGDTIEIRATVIDAYGKWTAVGSATAVVADSAPIIDTVSLSDATPTTHDVLVTSASTYDADGDPVTLTYTWTVNGITRQTTTTAATTDSFDLRPRGNGDNGDVVTVTVLATDGTLTSRSRDASATVTPGRNR
jgi:DNA-binding beta-propeller fold protein YncE